WYAAAWEREIGPSPYATTILGESVAIFRGASGKYAALADACPHRKVPMWMGDPALADPDEIFPAEHWGDPTWGTTDGDDMVFGCNYLHITDNLLDPSHVAWVHPGSFAGDGADNTALQTTIAGDGVTAWRWMMD